MPRLVQYPKKRARKMPLIVSRRDPAIVRPDARAKRMRRHIEAAALKVKSEPPCHVASELLLRRDRISTLDDFDLRPAAAGGNF